MLADQLGHLYVALQVLLYTSSQISLETYITHREGGGGGREKESGRTREGGKEREGEGRREEGRERMSERGMQRMTEGWRQSERARYRHIILVENCEEKTCV